MSNEFEHVPGAENVVADALSRIYSNDSASEIRARAEFTYHDVTDEDTLSSLDSSLLPTVATFILKGRNLPGAETGRPETSREFAACMRDKFVLHGTRTNGGRE